MIISLSSVDTEVPLYLHSLIWLLGKVEYSMSHAPTFAFFYIGLLVGGDLFNKILAIANLPQRAAR